MEIWKCGELLIAGHSAAGSSCIAHRDVSSGPESNNSPHFASGSS